MNAYKRNELDPETGLGIFSLSSNLSDLPEPSESLKATTVWQVGLGKVTVLLSSAQIDDFKHGQAIHRETDIRGCRGAYLVHSVINLNKGASREWSIVVEVNQDSAGVAALINALKDPAELENQPTG